MQRTLNLYIDPPVKRSAFLLGIISLIGQVVLLREYLTAFYGNETVYSLVLASWLLWVALGSLVASHIAGRVAFLPRTITMVFTAFAFLLPVTVLLIRSVKTLAHIHPGEMIGVPAMALLSAVTLAPVTFMLGFSFPLLCCWQQGNGGRESEPGAVIYFWESLGAAVGGILVTFVLLHSFSGLQIAFGLGITVIILSILNVVRRRWIVWLGGIVLALTVFLPRGAAGMAERWSQDIQWPGFKVVADTDSVYGRLTLTQYGGEYSLYENGWLSFTAGDVLANEERVHFAMLAHGGPLRVLLIGGGAGGGLEQILKYPGVTVDYVELDPKTIDVSLKFLPPRVTWPLRDPRVRTVIGDGRLFVKSAREKYDVIIIALGDPATALINRYYTREFFGEALRLLGPEGVLGLSVSSSENYLNAEAKSFLRSINSTLRQVFSNVQSIPGDTNVFLASEASLPLDPDIFTARLLAREVATKYVSANYLPFRMSADRLAAIRQTLSAPGRINTDERPVAFFYDAVLWSTHFESGYKRIMEKLSTMRFEHILVLPFLVLAAGWLLSRFSVAGMIKLAMGTTGFSQIIFQIMAILTFQTLYGYAYNRVGMIFGMFMLGLVLGSRAALSFLRQAGDKAGKIFKLVQAGMTVYPFCFPLIFWAFRETRFSTWGLGVFSGIFLALPVVVGFLGGAQYALGVHLLRTMADRVTRGRGESLAEEKNAGQLYAWDVLGAAAGALLTGTFLIPLFGINAAAVLAALVSAAALVGLMRGKIV